MSITRRERIAARLAAAFLVWMYGSDVAAKLGLAAGVERLRVRLAPAPVVATIPMPAPRPVPVPVPRPRP